MEPRKDERNKKAIRRNINSLLNKCEYYSKLGDIELALYIAFPRDGGFVSYESTDLSWRQDIDAKKDSTPPTLHLPGHQERAIGHKVTGFYFKQKRGRIPRKKMAAKVGLSARGFQNRGPEGVEESGDARSDNCVLAAREQDMHEADS